MRVCGQVLLATLATIAIAAPSGFSQTKTDAPPDSFPIQQLLEKSDHRDFPCKVTLQSPFLTYQQRYLIGIEATINRRDVFEKDGRAPDLHYVVRVADANGNWFYGQAYEHDSMTAPSRGEHRIEFFAQILFGPGDYTIAAIVYDSANQRANVQRQRISIPLVRNDPLAPADRVPTGVEFPVDPLVFDPGKNEVRQMRNFDTALYRPTYVEGIWAFTDDPLRLPIAGSEPVLIDIVVNFGPGGSFGSSVPGYQWNAQLMLQIASVLAGLQPETGCTRVTALDVLRQTVLLDRQDASGLNWREVRNLVMASDYAKVNVQTLANSGHGALFLLDHLADLNAGPSPCHPALARYTHVIIMASTGTIFPHSGQLPQARHEDSDQLYYVRPVVRTTDLADQIGEILRPAKPVVFEVRGGLDFRKALARIISGIGRRGTASRPALPSPWQSRPRPAAP